MPGFVGVADPVVVAIVVQVVNFVGSIRVDWYQANARRVPTGNHSSIKVVIQAVFVGIDELCRTTDATGCDVVLRGLSFHVVSDAVVVAIDVKRVGDSILVSVYEVSSRKDEL